MTAEPRAPDSKAARGEACRVSALRHGGSATLIDAACLGYDVIMLTDASATTSPAYCHDATVYNTRQWFGLTASTPDLLNALAAATEENAE
jgi:nicotinamidase-related amidase